MAVWWTEPNLEEETHQGTKTRRAPAESLGRSCCQSEIRRQRYRQEPEESESHCANSGVGQKVPTGQSANRLKAVQ